MIRRPVGLEFSDWSTLLKFCTEQVSKGGLSILLREPPPVGEPVKVTMKAPDSTQLGLLGKVIRLSPPAPGTGATRVGIHLFKPTAETLESLVGLVHRAREQVSSVPPTPFEEDDDMGLDEAFADPSMHERQSPPTPAPVPTSIQHRRSLRSVEPRTSTPRLTPPVPSRKAPIVGIDFGTTYSKVALVEDGEVVLIEDELAKSATSAAVPSVVAFLRDGSVAVGEGARAMRASDPTRVISSVKRLMGMRFHDPLADGVLGSLACRSMAGPQDSILFEIEGTVYTIPEICAEILKHIKSIADNFSGIEVREAVFTIPVEFNEQARRELKTAARMAGLDVAAMIPEPVAAAIGCGHHGEGETTVAIYDFGGGTFDASIVEVGEDHFTIRGAAGDRWLGGDDLDEAMAHFVADEFQKTSGIDLRDRVDVWQRLIFACEEAKRWLSTLHIVNVIVPDAAHTPQGPKTLFVPVTRAGFEELVGDIIGTSLMVASQAMAKEGLSPRQVDQVLVTGGTTRVPAIQDAVRRFFGREPMSGVHPEHSVVIGAAVHAAALSGEALPSNSVERLRSGSSTGRTVGIALAGGSTEHIIERSQRPPVAAYKLYSTSRDRQTACRIEIVEGDSHSTAENRHMGGFIIDGLPPAPAGTVDLEVYFELSSTGTLCVTAQERSTGRRVRQTFNLADN